MARIGLIGCGWLGKPLARALSRNHQLQCYTRKAQVEEGFEYILKPEAGHSFWDQDIFIIAIPTKDDYLQSLKAFCSQMNPQASVILCSSTSVYKEFEREVDESATITQPSLQKEAENLLLAERKDLLILRLGGLMGEDRIAGRWKSVSTFTDSPVNYIHQDDAVAIISGLIEKGIKTGIYNLVAPKHPLRSAVHQKNSEIFGFELGSFKDLSHRVVNGDKIIRTLNYIFLHPDPLKFWK